MLGIFRLFSFVKGRRFSNEIADRIGVNRALFSSALLEAGMTWAHIKMVNETGVSELDLARILVPQFEQGLAIVKCKFGNQPQILEAEAALERWHERDARSRNSSRSESPSSERASTAPERIVSSEFRSGRYELSYNVQSGERLRGKQVGSGYTYVLLSDDLDAMKSMALVKSVGGVKVSLVDTLYGNRIPFR